MPFAAELVKRALAALNTGRIDDLVAICDRDFELDMSARVFNPAVYHGHDGIRQFYAEVLDVWEHYVWEPEQILERGDLVVALVRTSGRGKGSGLDIDRRTAMIWKVDGDQAVSLRFYRDRAEALAAVDKGGS